MYLVTITCPHDDIPLRVFGERDAAVEFAKAHDGKVPEATLNMLSIDEPESLGMTVWDFDDYGLLIRREHVQWWGA